MSSSARRRVLRGSVAEEDVFVLGESSRETFTIPGAFASATEVLAAADAQAARIVAEARSQAAALVAEATGQAGAVRDAAHAEGFEAGRQEALEDFEEVLALVRRAASEGKAIRDNVAAQAAAVVARAAGLATRRIVGELYEADPGRTAAACSEALRAAAGQEVISIRLHPGVQPGIQAALGEAGRYVRPDEAIEVGGCIVDLVHGTIDATLEARLSLMELALARAGGEA
ncbi:MAG: hypothetical protein HY875_07385 [Chloroflexi bacterium]|nr:hypothetical protein [Chloroflexota bacterium]